MKARKFVMSVALGLGFAATLLVPLTLAGASLAGCCMGGGGAALAGLVVTVTDGPGGARICDATVTARDGSFSQVLLALASRPDCVYSGAYDRPGTYSIEVVSGTRMKTVENVRVTTSGARDVVDTRHLTIALDP